MSWRFVPYTFSHDYSVALFSFWKSTMRLYVSSEATYWHFWLHTALAFNKRFYHFCTTSFKKMNKFYPKYFFFLGPEYYYFYNGQRLSTMLWWSLLPTPSRKITIDWSMHGIKQLCIVVQYSRTKYRQGKRK